MRKARGLSGSFCGAYWLRTEQPNSKRLEVEKYQIKSKTLQRRVYESWTRAAEEKCVPHQSHPQSSPNPGELVPWCGAVTKARSILQHHLRISGWPDRWGMTPVKGNFWWKVCLWYRKGKPYMYWDGENKHSIPENFLEGKVRAVYMGKDNRILTCPHIHTHTCTCPRHTLYTSVNFSLGFMCLFILKRSKLLGCHQWARVDGNF